MQNVLLIDCICETTGAQIAHGKDGYVYLKTKAVVPLNILNKAKELQLKKEQVIYKDNITKKINELIYSEVKKYNDAHGTLFDSIHNCANYKDHEGYTHKEFCSEVWNWNVQVWETARELEKQIINNLIEQPMIDDFVTMLPVFNFTKE